MEKIKARGFRFRKRTIKLLNKLCEDTHKEQDQVVHAALIRYKKELAGKKEYGLADLKKKAIAGAPA